MAWLEKELENAYELKTQKLGVSPGYKLEGKVLNRIFTRTLSGWEMEADSRHAELIIEQFGLEDDKCLVTPGVSGADEEDLEEDTALISNDTTMYRGVIARCIYVGTDRPGRLFVIKERYQEMSSPTTG